MSLHADLLDQAEQLPQLDPRRPKQANLRRAISSAYFVTLQQARHEADYDLSRTYRKQEVLDFVKSARQAFEAWERVRKTDDARVYMACFHLLERWDEDPR